VAAGRTVGIAATLAATLAAAAVSWLIAVREMAGMDMGVATELGSFPFFIGLWVAMMAAMMLPGAVPALMRCARAGPAIAAPLFAGSYLAVWALVGVGLYLSYRPHSAAIAGAVTVAAGFYELMPLKRACRCRCRESVRSGLRFGLYCVSSSIGLTLVLLAVGAMSVTWMSVLAVLVFAQKLMPPRVLIDVPLALAIVGLGIAIAVAPTSVPGLTPSM
jgi:predicted metal-binding membrane protein